MKTFIVSYFLLGITCGLTLTVLVFVVRKLADRKKRRAAGSAMSDVIDRCCSTCDHGYLDHGLLVIGDETDRLSGACQSPFGKDRECDCEGFTR